MGLLKNFFSQTRKPEGFLGKLMVNGMNSGHAKLGDWGMERLPSKEVKNAIDLGCGGGRNVEKLMERYKDAFVIGADYSELSVETSRKHNAEAIKNGRCQIIQADVSDLKLDADSFDLATAFETIYFWPGLEKCFKEVNRVLKQGGHFLIVNESDGLDQTSKKFEKIIDGMKAYTQEEIISALEKAGFTVQLAEHHPKNPWLRILAIKK
ncbi:MAG: class I SAM-dependent methyltransferase [Solobacterium sp.]|nr:class I SAM-dependent methyltransferase [Solobacterium sp.]